MIFRAFFFVFIFCALMCRTEALKYDQSQNGDLNVQVDLKNLNIIALMKGGKEEYVDYDYAYDYSEMTIKPQNGTTAKPLNTTMSTPAVQIQNITATNELPYEQTTQAMSTISDLDTSVNTVPSTEFNTEIKATTLPQTSAQPTNPTRTGCKRGFAPNPKGECELKLQNPSTNALLKLVRLSQKLKSRRERTRTSGSKTTGNIAD